MESYGGRDPAAAAEYEHRPFDEPEEQEEQEDQDAEKECSSCCKALACCIRVTPWITALSVALIFVGLPFWAVYTRSALVHTQALLDGAATAAAAATPKALLLPPLRSSSAASANPPRQTALAPRPTPGPTLRLSPTDAAAASASSAYTASHPKGSEGPASLMPWLSAAVEWATSIGVVAVAALAGLAGLLGAARCWQSAAQRPGSRCGAPGRGAYAVYLVGAAAINPLVWLLVVCSAACLAAQAVWLAAAWAARAAIGPMGVAFAAAAAGSRLAAATIDRAPDDYALAARALEALVPLAAKPAAPQAVRDLVARIRADAPVSFALCPATCVSVGSLARAVGLPSSCVCMRQPQLAAAQAAADGAWVALMWSSAAMAVVGMAASWLLASGAAGSARVRRDLRYLPGRARGVGGSSGGGGGSSGGGGGHGRHGTTTTSSGDPLRAPRHDDNESMLRGGANASHNHAPIERPVSALDALAIKEKEAAAAASNGGGGGRWRVAGGRRSSSGGGGGGGGGGLFGGGGWRLGARRPSRDGNRASKDKDADVRITLVPAGAPGSCGGGPTGGGGASQAPSPLPPSDAAVVAAAAAPAAAAAAAAAATANPLVRRSAAVARSPSPPSAPPSRLLPDAVVGGGGGAAPSPPLLESAAAAAAAASRRATAGAPPPPLSPPPPPAHRSPAPAAGVSTTAQRYAAYRLRAAQEAAAAAKQQQQQQQQQQQ